MKLTELYGYKNNQDLENFKEITNDLGVNQTSTVRKSILYKFRKYLASKGYQPISHGAFGVVFTHPNLNYCIKVFKNDPAYLRFVQYAQNNTSEHLPKFRGKIMNIDNMYYAVRMEILTTGYTDVERQVVAFLHDYAQLREAKNIAKVGAMIKNLKLWLDETDSKKRDVAEYFQNNHSLLKIFDELVRQRGESHMDIHIANFMKRDDILVIVDPYVDMNQLSF